MSNKKVKAQQRIFKEMENQLMVQAERLGIRDDYTPLYLKELEYEALKKHLISFCQEKSNLEYEMQMQGSDKKEALIKLERLEVYIKRAERMALSFENNIRRILDKATPDKARAQKATAHKGISVVIGMN